LSFTRSLIDLKAATSNKQQGLRYADTIIAGPEPIERPKIIIELAGKSKASVK
jgi:hypothetical protein